MTAKFIRLVIIGTSIIVLLATITDKAEAGAGAIDKSFKANAIGGQVSAVAIQKDGKIIIGGMFRSVNGQPRSGLARLNKDGSLDETFRADLDVPSGNPSANTLAIQPDGKIIVGGAFETIGAASRRNLARLNPDGSNDASFNTAIFPGFNTGQIDVLEENGNNFVIGGYFTVLEQRNIGLIDKSGLTIPDFKASAIGSSGTVAAIAVQRDGNILVGGAVKSFNSVAQTSLARLRPNGSLDTSFKPKISGAVNAIAVDSKNKIIIGGDFDKDGGKGPGVIARLNKNGSTDRGFRFSGFADTVGGVSVNTILPVSKGKIVVGGSFMAGDKIAHNVARLQKNGKVDRSFRSGIPAGGRAVGGGVFDLAIQRDGKIISGGIFGGLNGAEYSTIARLQGR